MATPAGRRLTNAHRLAQARLGAQTVARMRAIWPLLDPANLDGTFAPWLEVALPIIQGQRSTSARLAASYLAVFKTLELGTIARIEPVLDEEADRRAVATSLLVTGPISVKRALVRSVPLATALDVAQASSAAAAMRHALNGGRSTITRTLANDRQAHGYARITGGKACDFCSMLAGRGAVYSAATGDFQAHDGCSCTAEPVYR